MAASRKTWWYLRHWNSRTGETRWVGPKWLPYADAVGLSVRSPSPGSDWLSELFGYDYSARRWASPTEWLRSDMRLAMGTGAVEPPVSLPEFLRRAAR